MMVVSVLTCLFPGTLSSGKLLGDASFLWSENNLPLERTGVKAENKDLGVNTDLIEKVDAAGSPSFSVKH